MLRWIFIAALAAGCAREIRSTNPNLWLEVESEHFVLRTDLPEREARSAIADLELIRNALLAASWHRDRLSPMRIVVVALASTKEMQEFFNPNLDGLATQDRFGQRLIIVHGEGNLLDSEVIKHEVTHALMLDYLVTDPRWVNEGIACMLETLEIDRAKGIAVRGDSSWRRNRWLRHANLRAINWSMDIMGMGAAVEIGNGYEFETLSWVLVHWLVDTDPKGFDRFLAGLTRGEGMWNAFAAAFPALTEEQIAAAMKRYVNGGPMLKTRVAVLPWSGTVGVRKVEVAEAHAIRAELFSQFTDYGANKKRFGDELARAKAADPANPLLLALSGDKRDLKLAVVMHPEDWRSWVVWFEGNPTDIASIRKAAELAPTNGRLLAMRAVAEQADGRAEEATQLAQRAAAIAPDAFVFHSLATIHEQNGRCAEAAAEEERAIYALADRVDPTVPATLRDRLRQITQTCGKADSAASHARTVEVEPVLKKCRQPLLGGLKAVAKVSAQFTIREDGTVTAVAIRGTQDPAQAGVLRQFVESCSFEPVMVEGKPRPVQVDLALEDLVQHH